MLDYLSYHVTDLTIYAAVMLVVFALARTANASPPFALTLAAAPVVVAWAFFDDGARVLFGLH